MSTESIIGEDELYCRKPRGEIYLMGGKQFRKILF